MLHSSVVLGSTAEVQMSGHRGMFGLGNEGKHRHAVMPAIRMHTVGSHLSAFVRLHTPFHGEHIL